MLRLKLLFNVIFLASCRRLKFVSPVDGRRLEGHVVLSLAIEMHATCHHFCVMKMADCVSVNIGPPVNNKVVCELNDADAQQHPEDLKLAPGWTYRGIEVRNEYQINR